MERASSVPAPQLGFEIRFRLTDGLAEDGALELWEDFVAGPVAGGGGVGAIAAGGWRTR